MYHSVVPLDSHLTSDKWIDTLNSPSSIHRPRNRAMPPTPRPHAFHLQLPPHHRAAKDDQGSDLGGLPYITIHAYNKSQSIWKLVKSLEVGVCLYCEVVAKKERDNKYVEDDDGSDEGSDEVDDGEEGPKTMVSVMLMFLLVY